MSAANWNIPPPTYDSHSTTTSYITTTLTPYLTLPHLLSLTWLATPILSLIFVAFRLQLSLGDAQDAVERAKVDLLASCLAAEKAATTAASMPRYMALATNKQFAEAVNGSMNAARATLVLSLTVMEGVINFIVDIYRSTFLCFLELVVRGGLAILIETVQQLNQAVQTIASGLRSSIQSDITAANNVIRTAVDAVNRVNPFTKITAPQITVPSLDSLQNVTLPASFQQSLAQLNATIPSVADIKQKVESVIDAPFELLKKDINDTFAGLSFQADVLPLPAQNTVTFCGNMDTSFIDELGQDLIKIAKIGVVIIFVLALLLVGFNCLLTWYRWICLKRHLEFTRQAWMTDPTIIHSKSSTTAPQITLSDHNLLMLRVESENPLITRIMNQLSGRLNLTPRQHTHSRWFLHYIFHGPALACFLIGFFGILSVEIQLLAMAPLTSKYKTVSQSTVSNFNQLIASSINSSMYNQSASYASEVNSRVDAIQTTINDGMFGWVNGTTITLNNTINEFYNDVQNAVSLVFNGTILESPAREFVKCFIGGKVDAIENAITFLHDNLHVDMPRVNNTVLVLSPERVDEATRPIAVAAIGGGPGDNGGFLDRIIRSYAASLKKERVMFGIFMALWAVVFVMGLSVILWHSYGKAFIEKRQRRKYQKEQRSGFETFQPRNENGGTADELRIFTPLPLEEKRASFKPFWLSSSKSSSESRLASSSQATLAKDRPWETAFAQPSSQSKEKGRASKLLLSVGRRAFSKEPDLKKDGKDDSEENLPNIQINDDVPEHRDPAWYNKMAALLARKKKDEDQENDTWTTKAAPVEQDQEQKLQDQPKPNLQVNTKRQSLLKEPELGTRSRFSTSPAAAQTSWKNIISPPKKLMQLPPPPAVVATRQPETSSSSSLSHKRRSSYTPFRQPPISLPIRPKQPTTDVPLDVGSYDDPFLNPTPPGLPVPLHSSFHTQSTYNNFGSLSQSQTSSPPVISSPKAIQHQTPLPHPPSSLASYAPYPAPPRPQKSTERHRKSVSTPTTSQWRVTNALPGDSAYSSASSLVPPVKKGPPNVKKYNHLDGGRSDEYLALPPPTRLPTGQHPRRLSTNPFITPFDDEHRVRIDGPSPEGLRKSMRTAPYGMTG